MQLNMWSRSQRQTVHDTVWAHCNAYHLRLVALIISHDSKSHPGTGSSFMNALDATDCAGGPHESQLEEDAWRNAVLDEVTEPVLMANDYRELLAEASGRIIILSNFADSWCCGSVLRFGVSYGLHTGTPLTLFSLASRTATAESLANMLEFEGIRVTSIYFGPLAEDSMTRSPDGHGFDSLRYVRTGFNLLMGRNHMQQAFPSILRYTCRSAAFRFSLICKRLAGVIRYVGTEDIQDTYSPGQPLTRRPATCGAVPVWFSSEFI
jgi:hypothetical protein